MDLQARAVEATYQTRRSADPYASVSPGTYGSHSSQRSPVAGCRSPGNEPYTIKTNNAIRSPKPKVPICTLGNGVDQSRRQAVLVSPGCTHILLEDLRSFCTCIPAPSETRDGKEGVAKSFPA